MPKFSLSKATLLLIACLGFIPCTVHAQNFDATSVGPSGGYIKDHKSSRVLVFVHGLFSNQDAWRCNDQNYWPSMIATDSDPSFADLDVYVAVYPTPNKHGKMTVADLVTTIGNRLEADGVFSRHKEVVFVAHSLGGIITQELLLTYQDQQLAKKVSFLYLFGSPLEGSSLANIGKLFSSDPLLSELEAGDGNLILHDMDGKWIHSGFTNIKRYCGYETQPEGPAKVVSRNSATRGCNDTLAIFGDHRSIVKPCSRRADSYLAVENKLRSTHLLTPATEVLTPPSAFAPNGIAITGGQVINPIVENLYNMPAPLPVVTFSTEDAPRVMVPVALGYLLDRIPPDKRMTLQSPHRTLSIQVDRDFDNPTFAINCSRPCSVSGINIEPLKSFSFTMLSLVYDDPKYTGFKLKDFTLAKTMTLTTDVQSLDESDPFVESVIPIYKP